MIHAWLLTSLLLGASPTGDSAPTIQLEKGAEITWRGKFSEAILRPNVRAFREYEIQTRLFVLETYETGTDIAFFTSIKLKPESRLTPGSPPIVRLELAHVDRNGKLMLLPPEMLTTPLDQRKLVPLPIMSLESLPTFETSLFVNFPSEKVQVGQSWNVPEDKRPDLVFRVEGRGSVGGPGFKVSSVQQTDAWDSTRPDMPSWRRSETIWVTTRLGYAARIERLIEKQDPQTGEVGFRSKFECDQAGKMRYPDRFYEERRAEIVAAAQFAADFNNLVADVSRDGEKPFDDLLERINLHTASHVASEAVVYREATAYIRKKAESAKHGHVPPAPPPPETLELPPLSNGKPAPELTLLDLTTDSRLSLNKMQGLPVVMVWYQPTSKLTAEPVLRFAEKLYTRYGSKAFIMPMAIGDSERALDQRKNLKLTAHVFSGKGVNKVHGIVSAPSFVVLDKYGCVKNITMGWSESNADAVRAELEKLLK